MDDLITYMGYKWIQSDEDGILTIGINEEGLDEFSEIIKANLPSEKESVSADEICGELETDQGLMSIYSPVQGEVVEINEAVVNNPALILEDCYGDGWLVRIEANQPEDFERFCMGSTAEGDESGVEE